MFDGITHPFFLRPYGLDDSGCPFFVFSTFSSRVVSQNFALIEAKTKLPRWQEIDHESTKASEDKKTIGGGDRKKEKETFIERAGQE
ncbi:hypothetical protein ES703_95446 [subsurface metagenome]